MSSILYMAISADGFIARDNDETPWSDEEWKAFQDFILSCDLILVGRRTYEIMRENNELVEGVRYTIVTQDKNFDSGQYEKIVINSKDNMPKAEKIGIIGGGDLNGRLAKLGVIDEIILDVEPIILGFGKRLFGSQEVSLELELLGSQKIGSSTVQNHYKVK